MNLKIQIFSLFFSFIYGVFFSFFTNFNYKYIFHTRKIFRIVFTIIFVVSMSFLYFIIINVINNGVIHLYFLLLILFGFYVTFPLGKKVRTVSFIKKKK